MPVERKQRGWFEVAWFAPHASYEDAMRIVAERRAEIVAEICARTKLAAESLVADIGVLTVSNGRSFDEQLYRDWMTFCDE